MRLEEKFGQIFENQMYRTTFKTVEFECPYNSGAIVIGGHPLLSDIKHLAVDDNKDVSSLSIPTFTWQSCIRVGKWGDVAGNQVIL